MHSNSNNPSGAATAGQQYREAIEQLMRIVVDGLRHGHFSAEISSEIGKDKRREFLIRAGKSHKFTIPEGELPR